MHVVLDPTTTAIFAKIQAVLSPVYLVGGSVRDCFLGQPPTDYDVATPLTPDEIEAAIRAGGLKPYTIGKRFGTIGFKLDGHYIEATTFRAETYQEGSRKPEVSFIDTLTHDLSRRDFTINAMAIAADGRLIDPFGGEDDLRQGCIRTVNKPYDRFNEDPLRMLRAARFAAQLGFSLHPDTEEQIAKKSHKIMEVSKERWSLELDKLLVSDHTSRGLSLLMTSGLLRFILPELSVQKDLNQDSPYHELDLWSHTLATVAGVPANVTLRWAALLHDVGKPFAKVKNGRGYSNYLHHETIGAELVTKIGPYLRWPTARTNEVRDIVLHHLKPESPLRAADTAAQSKTSVSL